MIYVCDSCQRNVRLTRTRDPHPRRAICPHCEHVGTLRRRLPGKLTLGGIELSCPGISDQMSRLLGTERLPIPQRGNL